MRHIKYKSGYKYQLVENYIISLPILSSGNNIETEYVSLSEAGLLTIRKGYAWDGPSGPTIDTRNAMRASLVHDALYQLIRLDLLSYKYRDPADDIFYNILREDGMSVIRASVWKGNLYWFGGSCARPSREKTVMMAP